MEEGWCGEKETLIIQITRYETQFWSGWQGLVVSKAFPHADFVTAEKNLGKIKDLKVRETVPWSILKWGWSQSGNHRASWTQDAQRQEQAPDVRATTNQGGRWQSLAWEHSLHDSFPKKHLWNSHSWAAASQETLALQKFSIQGIKICYGVTYGTASANILHFQMFRELQKY